MAMGGFRAVTQVVDVPRPFDFMMAERKQQDHKFEVLATFVSS